MRRAPVTHPRFAPFAPSVLSVLSLVAALTLLAGCGGAPDSGAAGPGGTSPAASPTQRGEATPSAPPTGGSGEATGADDAAVVAAQRLAEESLDDHGCGHGFTVGTADGTVRLSLWLEGGGYGTTPEPGTHELGGDWTGQLVTGEHLFAQWCDDVIEPDEPEVVEDSVWELTGTLTWEVARGDGQCPTVATATLRDATVVTDAGEVPLVDLELRNEFFGCFAG